MWASYLELDRMTAATAISLGTAAMGYTAEDDHKNINAFYGFLIGVVIVSFINLLVVTVATGMDKFR